ncbi:hypothetical protein [Klebsiella pneumoniae]|uniref:hypothetical protein n=1 Tax=Klebsiella pneumoniae TaxID=573 RepID=UPI00296EE314|nr:hypothetical protein [Klebsiella pneumoniae]
MTKNILSELGLGIDSPLAIPDAPNYRPPCWPPQRDWPVIIDAAGQVVSRWGDAIWRLDPWAGKRLTLNFGDGPAKKYVAAIDPANADLLRTVIGWWLYGPNGARGYRGLKTRFDQMRRLFVLCTQEGILASELSHFPRVADRLPEVLGLPGPVSSWHCCTNCTSGGMRWGSPCWIAQGWHASQRPCPTTRSSRPPISRPAFGTIKSHACANADDFLAHRGQVEECFRFCLAAYRHNSASLQGQRRPQSFYPFQWPSDGSNGKWTGRQYYGPFIDTAHRFGMVELFRRWLGVSDDEIRIQTLSRYLNLVSRSGLCYLLNFSLMRVEEAWNLRADCLHIERDPQFGDIHVLCGRTTKTMSDSEALWVTSPSAQVAVEAMRVVADLRAECDSPPGEASVPDDPAKRYLLDYCLEPWERSSPRSTARFGHRFRAMPMCFSGSTSCSTVSNCALRRKISNWLGW